MDTPIVTCMETPLNQVKFQWVKKKENAEKFPHSVPFIWNILVHQFPVRCWLFPPVSIHKTINTSSNASEEQIVPSSECSLLINHFCCASYHPMLYSDLQAGLSPQLLCRTLWAGTVSFSFLYPKHQPQFSACRIGFQAVSSWVTLCLATPCTFLEPTLPFYKHSAHEMNSQHSLGEKWECAEYPLCFRSGARTWE